MNNQGLPVLYIKSGCPYCEDARDFLDAHGVAHRELNVSEDHDALAEMKQKSGQDKTPTLDWNGEVLSDFDVEELKEFLLQHAVRLEDS